MTSRPIQHRSCIPTTTTTTTTITTIATTITVRPRIPEVRFSTTNCPLSTPPPCWPSLRPPYTTPYFRRRTNHFPRTYLDFRTSIGFPWNTNYTVITTFRNWHFDPLSCLRAVYEILHSIF